MTSLKERGARGIRERVLFYKNAETGIEKRRGEVVGGYQYREVLQGTAQKKRPLGRFYWVQDTCILGSSIRRIYHLDTEIEFHLSSGSIQWK